MKLTKAHILFIFVISFVLYGNTLMHDYALDDLMIIQENKFTKQGIGGISEILTTDSFTGYFGEDKNLLPGGRYRPLAQITFALEYQFFGLNPFVGHLVNVLLYFLLGIYILKVLQKIFKSSKEEKWYIALPFVITALYLAHPIHTEAVANIKGRDEILGFLGSMAALFYALEYIDKTKFKYLLFSFVWFAIGLLAKESALTFLAVIPLTLFFFRKIKAKEYAIVMLPVLLATIVFFALRYNALGFLLFNNVESKELLNNPFLGTNSSERLGTVFYTMGKYIKLMLFPHPLTHDYYPKQIAIINWTDIRAILPFLMYLLLLGVGIWGMLKKNIFAYGLLFFLITFSIVSNLFINIGSFMNERFVFGPSLGFVLAVVVLLYALFKKQQKTVKVFGILMLLVFSIFTAKTITRNTAWKNDYKLFTTDVKTSTNSAKVNVSAGGKTIEQAEKEHNPTKKARLLNDAVQYLTRGLEIHPEYSAGWLLLGNAQLKLKDYKAALWSYDRSLKLRNNYEPAINNLEHLAKVSENEKAYAIAESAYKKLMVVNQEKAIDYLYKTATLYQKRNSVDSAIIILKRVLQLNPSHDATYDRLGEYYGKYKQDFNTAILYLKKGVKLNPNNSSTLTNLGIASALVGDYALSIQSLEKSIALDPENVSIYKNLAITYMQMGNKAKADELMLKAKNMEQK